MALDLITPVADVFRRDYDSSEDASSGFLKPGLAGSLKAGEWVVLNSSGKIERAQAFSSSVNPVAVMGGYMQVFSQEGDLAAQALQKVCCLQLHDYEAETDQYTGTGFSVGDELSIAAVSAGQVVLAAAATSADVVVARCTKAISGGKLTFQKCAPYLKA
jgi:hypothetical protein